MLTINQIILLLDIFRGTTTQDSISTLKQDLEILQDLNLIIVHKEFEMTAKGIDLVIQVKQIFYNIK